MIGNLNKLPGLKLSLDPVVRSVIRYFKYFLSKMFSHLFFCPRVLLLKG